MTIFGRELTLDQVIGLVECNANPDDDLVHRAALELIAALREAKRRERTAVEDLQAFVENPCAVCKHLQDQQYCYRNCQNHHRENYRAWQWRGLRKETDNANG